MLRAARWLWPLAFLFPLSWVSGRFCWFPASLASTYGAGSPLSVEFFLRLRPSALVPSGSTMHAHGAADADSIAQNLALLSAVVALGGGPDHFSAATFRKALTTDKEERRLRTDIGVPTIERFDQVFGFVVADGIAGLRREGALPSRSPGWRVQRRTPL